MAATKHQLTIDTNISQIDTDRVLTSQHVKDSKIMTGKCLAAVNDFWYPIALSEDLIHVDAKVELAFLVDERKLSVYIDYSNTDRVIE